ncbi:hypothetical protein M0R45_009003 [Rubus argutus]|uniref:Uncharacterized protein n=1 Tax=Rubus argutus TaxID=59490 RepID=A0AAW1Y671_RUBAR
MKFGVNRRFVSVVVKGLTVEVLADERIDIRLWVAAGKGKGSVVSVVDDGRQGWPTEKSFLKQAKVFFSSKKTSKGNRPGKGGILLLEVLV